MAKAWNKRRPGLGAMRDRLVEMNRSALIGLVAKSQPFSARGGFAVAVKLDSQSFTLRRKAQQGRDEKHSSLNAYILAATVFGNRAQEGRNGRSGRGERRCLPGSFVVKHGIENNE